MRTKLADAVFTDIALLARLASSSCFRASDLIKPDFAPTSRIEPNGLSHQQLRAAASSSFVSAATSAHASFCEMKPSGLHWKDGSHVSETASRFMKAVTPFGSVPEWGAMTLAASRLSHALLSIALRSVALAGVGINQRAIENLMFAHRDASLGVYGVAESIAEPNSSLRRTVTCSRELPFEDTISLCADKPGTPNYNYAKDVFGEFVDYFPHKVARGYVQ